MLLNIGEKVMTKNKIKDHQTQRAYIKKTIGNSEYLLFFKDKNSGKYTWKLDNNYSNKIFMYKNNTSKFNPESNGRGSNPEFSIIESSVDRVVQDPQTLTLSEHNEKIIFGLQIIARLGGAQNIYEHSKELKTFNQIMNALTCNCELLIDKKTVDAIELFFKQKGNMPYKVITDLCKSSFIKYPKKYLIISDNSVWYDTKFMAYPINTDTLFFSFIPGLENNIKNFLMKSAYNWLDVVCFQSRYYLIADPSLPKEIQDQITNLYENGVYNLEEN